MVDRLLMLPWQCEMNNFPSIASKVGWSPLPGGYSLLERQFPDPADCLATDCSAFDWTMPSWLAREVIELKIKQTRGATPLWAWLVWRRCEEVIGPACVVRLPCGDRWRQRTWGLMKSGWLLTISFNGACQSRLSAQAQVMMGLPKLLLWAMGDDTLVKWDRNYDPAVYCEIQNYLGIKIKEYSLGVRTFAGYDFHVSGQPTPSYLGKHMEKLRWVQESQVEEMAEAYGHLYALASRELPVFKIIDAYGSQSLEAYRLWGLGVVDQLSVNFDNLLRELAW